MALPGGHGRLSPRSHPPGHTHTYPPTPTPPRLSYAMSATSLCHIRYPEPSYAMSATPLRYVGRGVRTGRGSGWRRGKCLSTLPRLPSSPLQARP
eukprot:898638-Rhodomonas_salina.2